MKEMHRAEGRETGLGGFARGEGWGASRAMRCWGKRGDHIHV